MKNIVKYMGAALMFVASFDAFADCSINLSVILAEPDENVPMPTIEYLNTRIESIVTADGISTDPGMGQFFISGKFNHIVEDIVPGPPVQTAIHTYLTLYIGDLNAKTIYASVTLELRGVGTSDQRAFINAMKGLNDRNMSVKKFISEGKTKVIDYYDKNYRQIISKARKSSSMHNYDEALWHLVMIPECCKGYNEAMAELNKTFILYINQQGTLMLDAAKAVWASCPDAHGAAEAFAYLIRIDPESSAYSEAQSLTREIKASVKSDRDFELRTKYHDSVDLERSRIQAAREVGVAFGKGQQPTTTNLMWLK